VCKAARAIEAGEITERSPREMGDRTPGRPRRPSEIFGMEPELVGARSGSGPEVTPAPAPELAPEIPRDGPLVDSLCEGWLRR